jgi:outer membrane lipoprotein-sorting protein
MVLAISGCGEKSQKDVVKDLDAKLQDLTGYKVKAKMTLQTGSDPQVYNVEIWHKSPTFYRVNLKNSQKEHNQMILRNKEGVFVLTPALNKSFKFQSDWPQNSSQAYLYESLVKDISVDKEATFKVTKEHYTFVTKTNYQNNKMLPKQEIILNKKDLTPVSVKVMDADNKPLITVKFERMKVNASFDNEDFDMEKNMTAAQFDVPTMAATNNKTVAVLYPTYEIPGVSLSEEKEVATDNGKRIIMTFDGEKTYTLVQENATVFPVNGTAIFVNGEPVDLGFTVGVLTDSSIKWSYQGAEFMIASNDLTKEEMVAIASSIQGQAVK